MKTTTNAQVKALARKPGRHLVESGGLYLRVLDPTKVYWAYRFTLHGRVREMSLGGWPRLTLAEARAKHRALRTKVLDDKSDPLAAKRAASSSARAELRSIPTFGKVADDYVRAKSKEWRHPVHLAAWMRTVTKDCAALRSMPVNQINTEAVRRVLQPLWERVPETGLRARGRIEQILNAARALGHIDPDRANPARWRGHLDQLLANPRKIGPPRSNYAAMPFKELTAYMETLRAAQGVSYTALAFTILTAARTSEVLRATWDEINLEENLWTVPKERMKKGDRLHRVPLSSAAMDLVRHQLKTREQSRYVFPGHVAHRPLAINAMVHALKRTGAGDYTVHGFRSAFRDWAGDETVFQREVIEAALSHAVGDATEAAYRRGDALAKRRELMEAWAQYLSGESSHVVVAIGERRRR
jgi:integrase